MPPLPPPDYEPGTRTVSPPPYRATPVESPISDITQLSIYEKIRAEDEFKQKEQIDFDLAYALELQAPVAQQIQEVPPPENRRVTNELWDAAEKGNLYLLKVLLRPEHGYDINERHGDPPMSPLQVAIANRHVDCVKVLLSVN